MKRKISWLLGLMAYVAPPVWAYFEKISYYKETQAKYGYVCGMPILAIIGLACIGAIILSCIALFFGVLSFRSLAKPRSWFRVIELVILGGPIIIASSYLCNLFNP